MPHIQKFSDLSVKRQALLSSTTTTLGDFTKMGFWDRIVHRGKKAELIRLWNRFMNVKINLLPELRMPASKLHRIAIPLEGLAAGGDFDVALSSSISHFVALAKFVKNEEGSSGDTKFAIIMNPETCTTQFTINGRSAKTLTAPKEEATRHKAALENIRDQSVALLEDGRFELNLFKIGAALTTLIENDNYRADMQFLATKLPYRKMKIIQELTTLKAEAQSKISYEKDESYGADEITTELEILFKERFDPKTAGELADYCTEAANTIDQIDQGQGQGQDQLFVDLLNIGGVLRTLSQSS